MSLKISNWSGRIDDNSSSVVPPNSILVIYYLRIDSGNIDVSGKVVFGPGATGSTIFKTMKLNGHGPSILNKLLVQFD